MEKKNDWIWWLVIISLLCSVTPVGLILLLIYLNKDKKQKQIPSKTGEKANNQDVRTFVDDVVHVAGNTVDDVMRSVSVAVNDALAGAKSKTSSPTKPSARAARTAPVEQPVKWVPSVQKKQDKRLKKAKNRAKIAKIVGLIMTGLFTFGAICDFSEMLVGIFQGGGSTLSTLLEELVPLSVLACISGIVALWGYYGGEKVKRFERYQNLIQPERASLSVYALADAMELRYNRVCDDLQQMIDQGYFEFAYLDRAHGRLILSPDYVNLYDAPAEAKAAPAAATEPAKETSEEDEMLRRIRAANDAIADPELSAKIDEIESLTRKIFRLLEERPEKADSLHSFTGYYLPQTLKLMEAYARLEAQGVEGENITAAKEKITSALDMVADGYRQQLDQLFQDDVVDISADIAVMEQMLARDGLSGEELQPEKRR